MESIIELRKKTGVLVAAHRGTSGGNIPPNSIAAFDIALKEGADILEMDLFQSIDGELFVFHTGMEPSHLDRHIRIERYTAGEIRQMRLCNGDLQQTFLPVNSFDDVLEHLKGKCKLNLDRSINIIEPVMKAVKKHGMEDQILMKSDPSDQSLKLIEAYAPTIDYMPIFMEEDLASDKIEKMNINYIGAEIVFEKETSPVIQESYLEMQKKKGRILWGNAILYSSRVPLAAGHSDDVSLTDDPAKGWGWLADKGFDIIQTDWTKHCVDYLKEKGAEILIETARVWADVGSFAECKGGKYCICDVTGPDEYNVLVDNNFYTNLMARENLRDAVGAVEYLKEHAPEDIKRLEEKLDFSVEELGLWREIIEKMYFPYDEKRQVYPMDDGFMMRKPWDENKIPPEKRAWLYENYHPLFIMRHRMSKQADAILGMYLHNDLFTEEEIRRNYDFYQEVTLHHSSLSTCIFGIVACDIGYLDEAYKYFSQSARMDLDDYHNNFYAGIHAANMAGTWQAIVNGFAGVRCQNGVLKFKPTIPKEWEEYAFRLKFKGALLEVRITKDEAEFTLLEGGEISFTVRGKEVVLKSGETYTYLLS